MVTGEIITVAVGQCGNQVSRSFWESAISERSHCRRLNFPQYDESSLFSTYSCFGTGNNACRARSILVDTEPAVVNETLRSRALRKLYDRETQSLLRVSGSGNNFARGFFEYGEELSESFLELMRYQVEACDSVEAVGLFHSLGGGTGSGLGTKLLSDVSDEMPKRMLFTTSVLPSARAQDVVTSPYNVVLSLAQLTEHASLVLPIDNSKLSDLATDTDKQDKFCGRTPKGRAASNLQPLGKPSPVVSAATGNPKTIRRQGFSPMNSIVARILIDLTAGTRFRGDNCTRIGEIISSMSRSRTRYITSSMAPLVGVGSTLEAYQSMEESRWIKLLFNDTFMRPNIMVGHLKDYRSRPTLASTLICRGLGKTDLNIYLRHWKCRIKGSSSDNCWCGNAVGAVVQYRTPTLLCLSNSSVISDTFQSAEKAFLSLYKKKAMLHHYTEFCDVSVFDEALHNLKDLIEEYQRLDELFK